MKTKKLFLTMCAFVIGVVSFAQEDWSPRVHLTGYINAIGEYSDCDNLKENYTIGLSEFGFLATYNPLEKLEFKSTIVYTHYTFDVSQLFVEAYAKYSINDALKITAGRFLTPLSPSNLYFYAPLNPSGVVPMLISHHFMFPQSISGFQLSGEFNAMPSFKIGYNASIGVYPYINHFEGGILGIQAQEDAYPSFGYYDTEKDKINNYLSGTGRIYGVFNDMITLGINYFTGDAQQVTQDPVTHEFIYYPSTKYTYGFDIHVNVSNIKFNAEYWAGKQQTTDTIPGVGHVINNYEAYYGELIYDGDIFKPFVRYDFIQDITVGGIGKLPATAYTVGLAVRPIYEALIKLEYKRLNTKKFDFATGVLNDYSYNYAQLSVVFSF